MPEPPTWHLPAAPARDYRFRLSFFLLLLSSSWQYLNEPSIGIADEHTNEPLSSALTSWTSM